MMAMRQLGRKITVISRIATVGTVARQPHPMTGHASYDSWASSASGGASFSTRRFFCSEPPSPPRRTQLFIDYMCGLTFGFVEGLPTCVAALASSYLGCRAAGIDLKGEFLDFLTNGRRDLLEDD